MSANLLGRGVDICRPTRWEGGWIYPGQPILKAYDISWPTRWEGVWIYLGRPAGKGGGDIPADPLSRSTLASITRHYASSAYPRRDYKFGQILSRFLSFTLPFANTNDHHGTTSYII